MARRKRRPRERRRKSRCRITSHLRNGGRAGGLVGGLFRRFDHVADAAHGLYELLRVAIVDLAAQVAYVDVDDVGEPVVVHIPDVLHDHGAAEGAALIAHHVFEDAEFLGGEVDGFRSDVDDVCEPVVVHIPDVLHDHGAAEGAALIAHHVFEDAEFLGGEVDGFGAADHLAANAVEGELGHLQAFGGGLAAAQQSADAGQELDEGEGLDQIIVGALFQALDAILEGAAGAQDQYRRPGFAVADLFQNLQTVHVGEHAVQNHQVVIGGVNALQRGAAGKYRIHRVSSAFQAPAEEVGDALFVLDD